MASPASPSLPRAAARPADRARALLRSSRVQVVLVMAVVVVAGGALRFAGANWDDGTHLHPDERYLSIVANDIRGPGSVGEYFDVDSPLSPYNVQSGRSYVYGELPLFATKATASVLGRDDYGRLYLVGRHVSAIVDTASILLVFLIGGVLFAPRGRRTALAGSVLASALYACSVTAIQHAHFFTVESWLVFFSLLAFWLAALLATGTGRSDATRYGLVLATGAAAGAAVSCKVGGAVILLPVALAIAMRARGERARPVRARLLRVTAEGLTVLFAAYVAFRLTSPYAFEHSSWLDVTPSHLWRRALEEQQRAMNGAYLYPPSYQWLLSTRIVSPARNELVWGLGPALGLTALAGLVWLGVDVVRAAARRVADVVPLSVGVGAMLVAFVVVSFAYYGTRFAHSIRYLVPIAPFLCLAAAYAIVALGPRRVARPLAAVVVVATLAWALAFTHVYRETNTRVAATRWLNTARPGTAIVDEHWDDALPVGVVPGRYDMRELPVFDADDGDKLDKLYAGLHDADLYVLSSPRAWRTIGRLPDRFPIMARFYRRLRAGELGFTRVARFRSEPELFGIAIDDVSAEETFWVYDHPPVEIYRRVRSFTPGSFRQAVCGGGGEPSCPRPG